MHPFKALIDYLRTLPTKPDRIEAGSYTKDLSQGIDRIYPSEGPSLASLAWWLPDELRETFRESEKVQKDLERREMEFSPPTAIAGIPVTWGHPLERGTFLLVYSDVKRKFTVS
jgi:hypothetical protein